MKEFLSSRFFRYALMILLISAASTLIFPGGWQRLFSSNEFLPHATCYLRNPQLIRLHVITDALIGLAYVSISGTLAYLVLKASRDIPFHWMFAAFGLFIVSCGITHFMEVWTVWQSVYWLSGYIKTITAAASLTTAIALFPLVPKIFNLIDSVKVSEERQRNLAKAHADLERSHKALEEQKTKLELANRDLELFAYSVAHDLRAPLRSMRSFAAILKEDYTDKLDEVAHGYGEKIITSSDKMNLLLNDLLAYSQISRGNILLKPVQLPSIMREVTSNLAHEIQNKKAEISFQFEVESVQADTTLLTQVLSNLLSNALKYVASDTTPQITIRSIALNESQVRIWVIDNGIGIDPKYHERIFGLFERLSLNYPGTGIGLTIVRRAMERMGGQVGLESELGKGTRFWIELPKSS